MSLPIQAISPLRQRMLEDMALRKLSDKTQSAYIRAVRGLAGYLHRRADKASAEDLRRYQLHMVETGVSPMSINATLTGLKFFFEVTADHVDALVKMHPVRVPQRLPVVLNREEVARLIACAGNAKYQAALSVAYGAGLRINEVVHSPSGPSRVQRPCWPTCPATPIGLPSPTSAWCPCTTIRPPSAGRITAPRGARATKR